MSAADEIQPTQLKKGSSCASIHYCYYVVHPSSNNSFIGGCFSFRFLINSSEFLFLARASYFQNSITTGKLESFHLNKFFVWVKLHGLAWHVNTINCSGLICLIVSWTHPKRGMLELHKHEFFEFCFLHTFLPAPFFSFGGILESASRAEFPVSPSNHVGFTPRLLYSSTHHSSESFVPLKTGWAQDSWLQWSHENWYFHFDISRWLTDPFSFTKIGTGCKGEKGPAWPRLEVLLMFYFLCTMY